MRLKWFAFFIFVATSMAVTAHAGGISHCYHWLNDLDGEKMKYIYSYAEAHGGELTFAEHDGATETGIYCTEKIDRSAIYGNRVIRIDFTDDVTFSDGTAKICGKTGDYYPPAQCRGRVVDVKMHKPENGWYFVLADRKSAIKSWTANSDELAQEAKAAEGSNGETNVRLEAAIAGMTAEKGQGITSAYAYSKARAGVDELIKNEKNWNALGGTNAVLERIAYSKTIAESEKQKLAEKALTDLLNDGKLNFTPEFQQLLDSSKPVKTAAADVLVANEAKWSDLGPLHVIDAIYFSSLPLEQRVAIVNKICAKRYHGVTGQEYQARYFADMQNSQALKDIYSRQIIKNADLWDRFGCLKVAALIANDTHLNTSEQAFYGSDIFNHMFGNVSAQYDRNELAKILAGSKPLQSAFMNALGSRFQLPLRIADSNLQLLVDGFVISDTKIAPSQGALIWDYALNHRERKTPALKASLIEAGASFN